MCRRRWNKRARRRGSQRAGFSTQGTEGGQAVISHSFAQVVEDDRKAQGGGVGCKSTIKCYRSRRGKRGGGGVFWREQRAQLTVRNRRNVRATGRECERKCSGRAQRRGSQRAGFSTQGTEGGQAVEREYAAECKQGETIETPGCVRDGMRVSLRVLEGRWGRWVCGVSEGLIDAY